MGSAVRRRVSEAQTEEQLQLKGNTWKRKYSHHNVGIDQLFKLQLFTCERCPTAALKSFQSI